MKNLQYLLCLFLCLLCISAKKTNHNRSKKNPHNETNPLVLNWQAELREKIAQEKFPVWMLDQIREELALFKEHGITLQDIQETIDQYPSHGFAVCQINNTQLSWTGHPSSVNNDYRLKMFLEGIQQLNQTVLLPNTIFLIHIGEAFVEDENKAPVFSWCRHVQWGKRAVSIPDYEALTGNYQYMQEVQRGTALYPWESKLNKAYWRGGSTGGWGFTVMPRLKLVEIAREFPQEIDAKLSGIYPGQDLNLFGPFIDKTIPISEHIQYKYQILVDGHVSAFSRAYWQLFSNCVIFKHTSPWYQWFYRELRPNEHYISYQADASDLIQKILWAKTHDNEVHRISENARHFAENHLKHSDIMLYVYLLLNEYAKLQH